MTSPSPAPSPAMIPNFAATQLQDVFHELNRLYFFEVLPLIPLQFSHRLHSTGGQYFSKPTRKIVINAKYLERPQGWAEIKGTLGHEMVHYWLDFQGLPCGHTPLFWRKLKSCGFPRYSQLSPRGARYRFQCPACQLDYFRKRKGQWSCGRCSPGSYSERYSLILIETLK